MAPLYFLVAALNCSTPVLENRTPYPFNEKDLKHFNTANNRCRQLYVSSPCVKRFIKRTTSDYSVICGKEENVK
jgi:hypothetical protein